MYDGPKRARDEVALLDRGGGETRILAIDGRPGGGDSHFAILPGLHTLTLGIEGHHVTDEGERFDSRSLPPLTVCFWARAGHSYAVRLEFLGPGAKAQIFDREGGWEVTARRIASPASGCRGDEDAAPNEAEPTTAAASEPAQDNAGPAPAPAAYEAPDAASSVRKRPANRLARAGTGAAMELGVAFGGDNLVTAVFSNGETATLTAGSGMLMSLVGEWTPVRSRAYHGFGVDLGLGLKYDSVGAKNGSVRFWRFPLLAGVHGLIHGKGPAFLLVRAGVEKDLRPALSGDGVAQVVNATFTSQLGAFGEGGIYWQSSGELGISITVRYTWMTYGYAGASIDASSIAVLTAFHAAL